MKDDIEEPMSDPRSLAETLYDESLGDDAGSLLRELLDLHAIRVSAQMPRQAGLALGERRGGWDRSCWSCRYAITGAIGPRRWSCRGAWAPWS